MKETSIKAYHGILPIIPTHHDLIMNVLNDYKDLTYSEIASLIGWTNPNKVSRRMPELLKLNKVVLSKIRKCSIEGHYCQTYLINPKKNKINTSI